MVVYYFSFMQHATYVHINRVYFNFVSGGNDGGGVGDGKDDNGGTGGDGIADVAICFQWLLPTHCRQLILRWCFLVTKKHNINGRMI